MSQALIDLVREKFPEAVVSSHSHRGDDVVTVKRENLVEVIDFLRNDPQTDLKLLRQHVHTRAGGWEIEPISLVFSLMPARSEP